MKNLENQLEKYETIIRDYLLDRLDSKTVRKIDEKIVTEPDFFNLVSLIEAEIVDDLVAGRLVGDERLRAEKIYGSSANLDKLNFSRTLSKIAQRNRHENQSVDFKEKQSIRSFLPQSRGFFEWLRWIPSIPVLTGLIIVASLTVWYFLPDKRNAMERELARINSKNYVLAERENIQPATLQPDMVRTATPMPKIIISSDDTVIGLRLGIINIDAENGIATFQDDNGNELFVIKDIKLQSDENGKYMNALVPAEFLPSGDYQIKLQLQQSDKTLTQASNYTFRIIRK